jgi:predicted amidohydrolase YtcJ
MKKPLIQFFTILLIVFSCGKKEYADTIIFGGTIYTVDSINSIIESIAIKDSKILITGKYSDLEKLTNSETKKINLEGKTMIPGFIEGHGHIMGVGYNEMNLDLLQTSSYDEIIEKVIEKSKTMPKGEWIIGRGWHQDKWKDSPEMIIKGFPTHNKLSDAVPNHPVYLRHASGHASLANSRAMEIFGINKKSSDPDGGEIFRDVSGNPTGVFNETAQRLINPPSGTFEDHLKALKLANDHAIENGITSFHDAGSNFIDIKAYKTLGEDNELDIRLYIMLNGNNDSLLTHYYNNGPEIGLFDNHLTIRSIKLYADGALGSRGAWLIEDYEDAEGEHGHIVTPVESLKKITEDGFKNEFQICTHAIGDMANREVLNIYNKHLKPGNDRRFRIEHSQHIDLVDIPRFGELGVIAAIQGIHMSSDRPWAIDRLGKKRIIESAYPWQKLFQSGAVIINGTDAPVEPINPIASFYASVSRKTLNKTPEGGYEPEEKMSRELALRTYTINGAFGAFEENIKGNIENGKLADFTVLDQDIMTVEEDKILDTKVDMTIIGGKVVFKRN